MFCVNFDLKLFFIILSLMYLIKSTPPSTFGLYESVMYKVNSVCQIQFAFYMSLLYSMVDLRIGYW